jgi:hypothetical protein
LALLFGAVALLHTVPVPNAISETRGGAKWRLLLPGVEYLSIAVSPPLPIGDSILHVVRIDPSIARLRVALASRDCGQARTAAAWCKASGLSVAINLGMFQANGRSNVGYLRAGIHRNNPIWNGYRSAVGFYPKNATLPNMRWIDPTAPGSTASLSGYELVVQNLRLIKTPGIGVWAKSTRRWSEAAVGADAKGRVLFLFCRSPYSMWEFNRMVLALPLGIVHAMHVEGGPEASLSLHAGGLDLDLSGSFETDFMTDDSNDHQWPIPNVIGVSRP